MSLKSKMISVVMCLSILLMFISAHAATTQAGKQFASQLDNYDLNYTHSYSNESGTYYDRFVLQFSDLNSKVIVYIADGIIGIRVWNVVDFTCNINKAYQTCSDLTKRYKFVRLFVDTSDNSITLAADLVIPENVDTGALTLEYFFRVLSILNDIQSELNILA